ncbi:hypothetical protein HYV31_03660 [candidate division WWE3 bacterium]|nr:hypothetical protein [candidate division WWE3 bacterium]
MRVGKLSETIKDRNALFDVVLKLEPSLVLGSNNDQVRNLVKQSTFGGIASFTKIGLAENLRNSIEFQKKAPKFKSFTIPEILSSAEFNFQDLELIYTVEREVQGESLYKSRNFDLIDKNLIAIQLEIDSIADLGLNDTIARKNKLATPDGYTFFKNKLNNLLKFWYDNSTIKFENVLKRSVILLDQIQTIELGNAHGEFNFHHIFSDSVSGSISIIDWERFSQATIRFFDIQEYIGRVLVFDNDFDRAFNIMSKFRSVISFDKIAFEYSLWHRILGSIYEGTEDKIPLVLQESDETKFLDFVKEVCN